MPDHDHDVCKFEQSLSNLTVKIDDYIKEDTHRYEELLKLRAEDSRTLGGVCSSIDTLCEWAKESRQVSKDVSANKSTLKMHGWFIKTIAGFILVAALGGGVVSAVSCPGQDTEEEDRNAQMSERRH